MILYTLSIDSGTPEQCAMVRIEMELTLGYASSPMDILIALEGDEDEQAYRAALATVEPTQQSK